MSDTTPVIETHDLTRRFGKVTAVAGLDLSIGRGEIFGLIGPDGAGKTTALRLLAAVMLPTSGQARVLGFDTRREAEPIRRAVGYMPQRFSLYGDLTVAENLTFFADIFGVRGAERRERIERLLAFARLTEFTKRRAAALSGGMQKKLALACTLIHAPQVIFLDEPTTGVDPISRREFWDILAELHVAGVTIVISTPYMDEAERCSRIGLMYEGQLIECDTPDALRRQTPGELLAIWTPAVLAARAVVTPLADVFEAQTYGDLLHVFVADAASAEPRIRAALAAAAIPVTDIKQTMPRVEEAFISLIQRRQKKTDHAAILKTARCFPKGCCAIAGQLLQLALSCRPAQHDKSTHRRMNEPTDHAPRTTHHREASPGDAARPTAPALITEDLTKTFGSFVAVDHISFSVPRGSIFGFLGPNGSGKTTTIRMLLGLLQPSAGRATILGFDCVRQTDQIRRRAGYMSQRFSLYNDLTVAENLNFYGRTYGVPRARFAERKQFVLEMAGLIGRERELTRNLSGGWKQRLALGAAILHEPEIIFLDEPTAGVDPVSRRQFWELLYTLAGGGATIFVTTHYMDEAEQCQALAFIHRGHIVAQGSPAEIKASQMRGQVLEITCRPTELALPALKALGYFEEVALYGARIHAVAEGVAELLPRVEAALAAAGVAVEQALVIPPSLEDVFIARIR